jgi:hypothetical protein
MKREGRGREGGTVRGREGLKEKDQSRPGAGDAREEVKVEEGCAEEAIRGGGGRGGDFDGEDAEKEDREGGECRENDGQGEGG